MWEVAAVLNLIRNENMKLYRRPRNRLILLAIFVLVSFLTFMVWHFSSADLGKTTMWNLVSNVFLNAKLFLYIFSVIVAGDIVASEFTTGTIKMLAIRPISRSRILLSKYIASLLFALTCIAVYFVTAVLVGGILEGFKGFSVPHVSVALSSDYSITALQKTHYLIYLLQQAGYYFVEIGLFVTLAFLVSTIFKSSSMAIGISSFLLFFNLIFSRVLAIQFDWMKYYLFTNTDLQQFAAGNSPIRPGMTLSSALITIAIYFIGMIAITWTIFNRRDIRV